MCNEIETKPAAWHKIAALAKRAALPALIYLGVAVGLPALNGASLKFGSAFWRHAAATGLTLAALVALLLAVEAAWGWAMARLQRER